MGGMNFINLMHSDGRSLSPEGEDRVHHVTKLIALHKGTLRDGKVKLRRFEYPPRSRVDFIATNHPSGIVYIAKKTPEMDVCKYATLKQLAVDMALTTAFAGAARTGHERSQLVANALIAQKRFNCKAKGKFEALLELLEGFTWLLLADELFDDTERTNCVKYLYRTDEHLENLAMLLEDYLALPFVGTTHYVTKGTVDRVAMEETLAVMIKLDATEKQACSGNAEHGLAALCTAVRACDERNEKHGSPKSDELGVDHPKLPVSSEANDGQTVKLLGAVDSTHDVPRPADDAGGATDLEKLDISNSHEGGERRSVGSEEHPLKSTESLSADFSEKMDVNVPDKPAEVGPPEPIEKSQTTVVFEAKNPLIFGPLLLLPVNGWECDRLSDSCAVRRLEKIVELLFPLCHSTSASTERQKELGLLLRKLQFHAGKLQGVAMAVANVVRALQEAASDFLSEKLADSSSHLLKGLLKDLEGQAVAGDLQNVEQCINTLEQVEREFGGLAELEPSSK